MALPVLPVQRPWWLLVSAYGSSTTCPDCAATAGGPHLNHRATCPLDRAVDQRCAEDLAWFAAHPWADEYHRAPDWSELADVRMLGLAPDGDGDGVGRVVVRQLAPGVLARRIGDVMVVSEVPQ